MCDEKTVLISLIIPAYNAEKYIGFTIESLMKQSYTDLEIIVVDDGSIDRTREIAYGYAESDARINVISQDNKGVASARNRGINVSNGEFVGFIDADDIWHWSAVEKMLGRFEDASHNLAVVYTWSTDIDQENRLIGGVHLSQAKGHVFSLLVFHNFLGNASSTLIRKSCLEKVGGYCTKFDLGCEDLDLYLRIASRFEFEVVPEFLVAYRRTPNAMSSHLQKMERAHQQVLDKVAYEWPKVSRWLLRSSKVNFYAYLAHSAERSSNHLGSLHWIRKSFRTDPILTLCRIDLLAVVVKFIYQRRVSITNSSGEASSRKEIFKENLDGNSSSFHPPRGSLIKASVKCALTSAVHRALYWRKFSTFP